MDIDKALRDPNLFGGSFAADSWWAWKAILKAIFCLRMNSREVEFFKSVSGGRPPPKELIPEVYILAGRRSGKSRIASLLASWKSAFFDYAKYTAPGESVLTGVCSHTRETAAIVLSYIKSFFQIDLLQSEISDVQTEKILLKNGGLIGIQTAKRTSARGYAVPFFILEESSFFKSEGVGRDEEILSAIYPATATLPESMIMSISTPYASSGINFDAWKQSFGCDDPDRLVLVAPSIVLNPTLNRKVIDRQVRRDPVAASSEWILDPEQPFRRDISNFIDLETIESCTETGCKSRPPQEGMTYFGFFDAAGGRGDSSVLAISHREGTCAVLDVLRGADGRHDPKVFIKEASGIYEQYGINRVTGDKYAAEFVTSAFAEEGIQYLNSELSKSEIYSESLPLFTAGEVVLLDHEVLRKQLSTLERRTGPSGRDVISHPPRGSDDYGNAACGALLLAKAKRKGLQDLLWL